MVTDRMTYVNSVCTLLGKDTVQRKPRLQGSCSIPSVPAVSSP